MKYAKSLLLILIAVSCARMPKVGIYTDNMTMPSAEGSSDSLFFSLSIEYADGGLKPDATANINASIRSRAFDLEDSPESIADAAVNYRENLIDEYLTDNPGASWEDLLEGKFTGRYKGWINYLLTYYSYKGGAHGIQTVSPVVFDAESGAIVSEADIFADGYEAPVAGLLREAVKKSMLADSPDLLELVEMDLAVPNNNFEVCPDGIRWYFQPYEIGPYVLGVVSAQIAWNDLKPWMK